MLISEEFQTEFQTEAIFDGVKYCFETTKIKPNYRKQAFKITSYPKMITNLIFLTKKKSESWHVLTFDTEN